jgi:hypothetical protein
MLPFRASFPLAGHACPRRLSPVDQVHANRGIAIPEPLKDQTSGLLGPYFSLGAGSIDQLFTQDLDLLRRVDSGSDLMALHTQNADRHLVPDPQGLADTARQTKQGAVPWLSDGRRDCHR